MKIFGLHIVSSAALARLRVAGGDIAEFVASEADKAVLALKSTDIGAAVAQDIATVNDHALSGVEKFEKVLANTLPLVLHYVTAGGINAALKDVEDIARSLVQAVFNDFKSTSAGKVARAILALFKK
jgi:hypothetical protein